MFDMKSVLVYFVGGLIYIAIIVLVVISVRKGNKKDAKDWELMRSWMRGYWCLKEIVMAAASGNEKAKKELEELNAAKDREEFDAIVARIVEEVLKTEIQEKS